MAQSLLISPSSNSVRSPVPKRFRLSLKQSKTLLQESDFASSPKKALSTDSISLKNKDDMLIDSCDIQDENLSPNCKVPEISAFVNPEVVDSKNSVSALGLPNCGNTCYLNSILQVLRYTPNFLNCVHSLLSAKIRLDQVSPSCTKVKESDLFLELHMLYITMKKQEDFLCKNLDKDFSTLLMNHIDSFLLNLREVSSLFEEGEQHDAHELLLTLLSTFTVFFDCVRTNIDVCRTSQDIDSMLVSDMKVPSAEVLNTSQYKGKRKFKMHLKKRQKLNSSRVEKSQMASVATLDMSSFILGFEGKIRHIVKCLECEKKSERDEPFTNLEVSIAEELINEDEGSIDLCQCLNHRIKLSGENKYFCDDCYQLNEAELSSEIISLPSILLIHCNWLKQSSVVSHLEKDSTKLLIPMSLKASENANIFHFMSDDVYCLYAVVLHLGTSTENGHYVSFIRDRPKASELVKKDNNVNLGSCCASEEILNIDLSPMNRWLLFDDQNVTPISVSESSGIFPYYQFLGIAASPCIIFYYKM